MFWIVELLLVAGLVKFHTAGGDFRVAAGIYTAFAFVLALLTTLNPIVALVAAGLSLVVGLLYFFLLDRFEGDDTLWWVVAVGGGMLLVLV